MSKLEVLDFDFGFGFNGPLSLGEDEKWAIGEGSAIVV